MQEGRCRRWAAQSFYDPARYAAIMTVVPACSVNSAAALDTLAYSLMAVLGGAAGAALLDWSGPSSCFLADAACSMVAAVLLARLVPVEAARMRLKGASRRACDREHVARCRLCDREHPRAGRQRSSGWGGLLGWLRRCSGAAEGGAAAEPLLAGEAAEAEGQQQQQQQQQHAASTAATLEPAGEPPQQQQEQQQAPQQQQQQQEPAGLSTLWAGLAYLGRPGNADLALLTLAKGSAALVWGAADVINGRLATQMTSLGDPATTLAVLTAAIGVGAPAVGWWLPAVLLQPPAC
jgi:hypothetical protein